MANADLARIINSDEIQSIVNPAKRADVPRLRKKNPLLVSLKALEKLDPYAAAARKAETLAQEARAGKKAAATKKRRMMATSKAFKAQGKAFYAETSKQGSVCEDGFNPWELLSV